MSFARGFMERGDQNDRRRVDLAKAFQQMRAENPHATLAEMQMFIDQMAGGRNYIAGGAPSGAVLEGIAAENQKAKTSAEKRKRLEDLRYKEETATLMENAIRPYLLDHEDVNEAEKKFLEESGINPDDIDLGRYFTPGSRNRVLQEEVDTTLPRVKNILGASDPSEWTVEKIMAESGVSRNLAEATLAAYTREWEQAQTERANAAADRVRTHVKDILDYAEKGYDVRDAFERVGITEEELALVPDHVLNPILDRHKETRVTSLRESILDKVGKDPAIQAAIVNGKTDEAEEMARLMLEKLVPADLKDDLKLTVDDVIRGHKELATTQANAQRDQKEAAAEEQLRAEMNRRREENANRVQQATDLLEKQKRPNAATAVSFLAGQYYMTTPQIAALTDHLMELNPMDVSKTMEAATAFLTEIGAQDMTAMQDDLRTTLMGGLAEPRREFPQIVQDYTELVAEMGTQLHGVLETVRASDEGPEAQLAALKLLREQVPARFEQLRVQTTRTDPSNRHELLIIGSQPWDQSQIEGTVLPAIAQQEQTSLVAIDREIARLEQQIAAIPAGAQADEDADDAAAQAAQTPAASYAAEPATEAAPQEVPASQQEYLEAIKNWKPGDGPMPMPPRTPKKPLTRINTGVNSGIYGSGTLPPR